MVVVARESAKRRGAIKDGIVYDAKQLLVDIRQMVRQQKQERGIISAQGGS